MSEWRNYNRTYNLWNFPENFSKFYMRTYMTRGVLTNIINPTDDFEWTVDLIDKIEESDSEFYKY